MKLHQHRSFANCLTTESKPQQKRLIQTASSGEILSLCATCQNTLIGNARLTPKQKQGLSKHKCALRKLTNENLGAAVKKRFLLQGRGLQTFLLSILALLVSSLF